MILLLPSNSGHVQMMLPIAGVIRQSGSRVAFLTRDSLVEPPYRVEKLVEEHGHCTISYSGYYKSGVFDLLPSITVWCKMKKAIFEFLESIEFEWLVVGNDCSVPFERLAIEYCHRRGLRSMLVQESVRPKRRRSSLWIRLRRDGGNAIAASAKRFIARRFTPPGYSQCAYGHSNCSVIATAGDAFRRRLIADGVDAQKIHVTGQPRIDDSRSAHPRRSVEEDESKILLFCSQPSPAPQSAVDSMFIDLLTGCRDVGNVRLLVKLHPRDLDPEHWQKLVQEDLGPFLVDVTKTETLDSCFAASVAMVTVASTTCLEAMQARLPVGLVNYLPVDWYLPYGKYEAVLSIESSAEIVRAIRLLVTDSEFRDRLIQNSERILLDELYLRDGKSAKRIADLLTLRGTSNDRSFP